MPPPTQEQLQGFAPYANSIFDAFKRTSQLKTQISVEELWDFLLSRSEQDTQSASAPKRETSFSPPSQSPRPDVATSSASPSAMGGPQMQGITDPRLYHTIHGGRHSGHVSPLGPGLSGPNPFAKEQRAPPYDRSHWGVQ
ncbi:hypothetical protein PMZ80_010765 [Knufia obscura]|uniref:Uncharacterized protein n=2 Tax=Knufia TaxID=430999 RepID=A0AAN8I1S8_9EURO|nr:hypothetical protein PMZ80_010765 [Knufia obscura]KAK5949802.1 hypothetical protein OHC33_009191 [Knufia fluminis]